MPYSINRASSPASGISVVDASLNTTFSIPLIGKGYANYGEVQQESMVRLLENFASPSAPLKPTPGQLWFDLLNTILYVRTAAGQWKNLDETLLGSVADVHISPEAGISISKLEHGASAQVMILDTDGVPRYRNITGDISIDYLGDAQIKPFTIGHTELQFDSVRSDTLSASIHITKLTTVSLKVDESILGDLSGNADTATALDNPRQISLTGEVSSNPITFDGTADQTFNTTIGVGVIESENIAPQLFVNQLGSLVFSSQTITASTINALLFTGNLIGNASTSNSWSAPRKITLAGQIGGSVLLDGSGDVVLTTQFLNSFPPIAANAITSIELKSESVKTTHIDASVHINSLTTQQLTANGFVGYGTLHGNTSTATKLLNPRKVTLNGDVSGSINFDGSVDVNFNTVVNTATKLRTPRKIIISGDAQGQAEFDGSGDTNIVVTIADDPAHNHDGLYYPKAESNSRYLRKDTSDTHTGTLTVVGRLNLKGEIDHNGFYARNLRDPKYGTDSANKRYVDARIDSIRVPDHYSFRFGVTGSGSAALSLAKSYLGSLGKNRDVMFVQWHSTAIVGTGNGARLATYRTITAYYNRGGSWEQMWETRRSE